MNNIIKQKINLTRSLSDDIKTKQLQGYGHVQRMEEGRLPKEVTKWRPPGRKKRGRSKLTWAEGIRGLMGEKGLTLRLLMLHTHTHTHTHTHIYIYIYMTLVAYGLII